MAVHESGNQAGCATERRDYDMGLFDTQLGAKKTHPDGRYQEQQTEPEERSSDEDWMSGKPVTPESPLCADPAATGMATRPTKQGIEDLHQSDEDDISRARITEK